MSREPKCDTCGGDRAITRKTPDSEEYVVDCPSCTQASVVSERVSDERLAVLDRHLQFVDYTRKEHRDDLRKVIAELQRLRHGSGELVETLRGIANAKRFNREHFDDDTGFADWARSRARHAIRDHARLSPEGSDEASTHNQESVT
jgi:hypothetical protein